MTSGVAMRAGWFRLGYLELSVVFVVSGGAAVLSALANYRSQNLVSRSIAQVMVFAALTPFPMLLAAWRLGLPAESVLGLDALLKAGGSLVLGVVLQPIFRWVAVVNLATAAALLAAPGTLPLEISAGGLAVALLVVVVALRRGEPQVDLEPR
jgi:hypothetical protein